MEFKKLFLEDRETLNYYFKKMNDRACELTFANTLLWSVHYHVEYTMIQNMLVFIETDGHSFTYPMGEGDIRPVIEEMIRYSKELGVPFRMRCVTEKMFASLEEAFPGRFTVEYNRDDADYLYLSEKLIAVSGKKYHSKKNHINRFKDNYPDWSYERITDENVEECMELAQNWREMNACEEDEGKRAEFCVSLNYLRLRKELAICGGLIRAGGRVVAFSMGEPLSDDTFVVHIEKAYAEVQGAYPMINQQFAADYAKDYLYINREEDLGSEGLRKAKLSYKPIMMVDKGIVKEIE